MSVKEFTIGCSRTINLGNFESMRVEATITWDVDADGLYQPQVMTAQKELRLLLEQTYLNQRKEKAA